jgi:hypothetical protein
MRWPGAAFIIPAQLIGSARDPFEVTNIATSNGLT